MLIVKQMGLLGAFSAFLSSYLATTTTTASVRNCGSAAALYKITELRLEPTNPAPGQEVTLILSFDAPEGLIVTDGTSTYEASFNFIPLAPVVKPLCGDVTCPIEPGKHTNTTATEWPSGVTGSFKSKMRWATTTGAELLCVELGGSLAGSESETEKELEEGPAAPTQIRYEEAEWAAWMDRRLARRQGLRKSRIEG
jgi:hypothetical protein